MNRNSVGFDGPTRVENQPQLCREGVDLKEGFQFPEVKKKRKDSISYAETTSFTERIALKNVTVTFQRETLKLEDVIFF